MFEKFLTLHGLRTWDDGGVPNAGLWNIICLGISRLDYSSGKLDSSLRIWLGAVLVAYFKQLIAKVRKSELKVQTFSSTRPASAETSSKFVKF